jgi:hypothetical protein
MSQKPAVLRRSFYIGACLCLISIGCGPGAGLSNYEKVKDGMTESEVDALLGKGELQSEFSIDVPSKSISIPIGGNITTPAFKSSDRSKKWKSGTKVVKVGFSDGKVITKSISDETEK